MQRSCPNCQKPITYSRQETLEYAASVGSLCSACTSRKAHGSDTEQTVLCFCCHTVRRFKSRKKWKEYMRDHMVPSSRLCLACWRNQRRRLAMEHHPVLFMTSLEQRLAAQWSLDVRARDGHCVSCQDNAGLHAHHRLQVHRHPFLSLQLDNGVTLCRTCHDSVHGSEPPVNDTVAELRTHLLA